MNKNIFLIISLFFVWIGTTIAVYSPYPYSNIGYGINGFLIGYLSNYYKEK